MSQNGFVECHSLSCHSLHHPFLKTSYCYLLKPEADMVWAKYVETSSEFNLSLVF